MKASNNKKAPVRWLALGTAAALVPLGWAAMHQAPVRAEAATVVPVKVVKTANGYQLLRGGKPYFIKGASGDGSKTDLKAAGANAWRTYGVDPNMQGQLDEAQTLGMTVTAGIWLGHKEHGFSYEDADAVAKQKEAARQDILKYRNSPALLQWGIGNEMENGMQDDPNMWAAVEDIAKMAHQLDPNHPTMVVVAEIGGDKVAQINARCPDIDIVGLNSYGGGASVGDRYKAAGGVKPYEVTEFGPAGTWESGKNAWGAVPELTSTEKADKYKETYQKTVLAPLCLGSYAFTWGNKQEATATWFGLRLPDGSKLGAVDALTQLWSGKPAANLCPVIHSLSVDGSGQAAPGATVQATLDVSDPENDPLKTTWILQEDPADYNTGGDGQAVPPTFPEAIAASSSKTAAIKMPSSHGSYRLYAYIHDSHGGAAVGNVSLNVKDAPATGVQKAALPLVIYGPNAAAPFIASGYMGNLAAIKLDPASTDTPHLGKTCLKVSYTAADNWGGVVWQNPENNWGDKAGGWDLTGAKTLSFWARGAQGGEVVSFSYGLIGADKPFHDTGKGTLDKVALTKEWKQYTIDLKGQDLSRIVSGFSYALAASGQPVTFYLDDIKYQ